MMLSWFGRMINHTGTETRPRSLFEGSSREYWTNARKRDPARLGGGLKASVVNPFFNRG